MSTTSKRNAARSISSNQLAQSLKINPKTAWLFQQKVRIGMKSSKIYPLTGEVEVDEAFIGGKEDGHQGRGNESKFTIVVAIEKTKNDDGIKRVYALKIENTSSDELVKIFEKHIDQQAQINTDKWTGYNPLTKNWHITQEKSRGGENRAANRFQLMHRLIQGLKSWIRGIHHKVSAHYLQAYLDEYCYRFNRNIFKETIVQKTLNCRI